jgi:outer membrane protein
MMQQLRNPKNVKVVSLFIAAVFVIGCFALSLTQSGFGKSASAAASESAIGVVNYQMLIAQCPDIKDVQEKMNTEIETAQKEFEEKSKGMNDAEKRRYFAQSRERLQNKQTELMEPVNKKIEETIKKVADKKGLAVVVEKNTVVYGGLDITDEVVKALQAAK